MEIQEALGRLDKEERELILLRYINGESVGRSNGDAEYNSETENNTEDDVTYLFALRDRDENKNF